jgi:hypothetical protein
MARFLSGRENLKEFSGLSSDRHLYLSLDEAEPNLGYPGEKQVAAAARYFTLVTIENGTTYDRYWVEAAPAELTAGISIFDEDILVGTANSVSKLNFVGRGVVATASGSISTITVDVPTVTISDNPPIGPYVGDLWWDSSMGDLRIFYQDQDSSQWVDANGGSAINPWIIDKSFSGIHTLGNVGIGTTTDQYYLSVGPVGYSQTSLLVNGNSTFVGDIFIDNAKSLHFGPNSSYGGISPVGDGEIDLYFGSTGIGSTTDRRYKFAWQVDRNIVLYDGATAVWSTGTNTSDENLKDNIRPTNINSLNILNHVNVVDFEWKPTSELYDGGLTHTGFIAQNIEDKIPNAVKEFSGIKLVQKEELIPVLWKALQEAFNRIEILEEKVKNFEEK